MNSRASRRREKRLPATSSQELTIGSALAGLRGSDQGAAPRGSEWSTGGAVAPSRPPSSGLDSLEPEVARRTGFDPESGAGSVTGPPPDTDAGGDSAHARANVAELKLSTWKEAATISLASAAIVLTVVIYLHQDLSRDLESLNRELDQQRELVGEVRADLGRLQDAFRSQGVVEPVVDTVRLPPLPDTTGRGGCER